MSVSNVIVVELSVDGSMDVSPVGIVVCSLLFDCGVDDGCVCSPSLLLDDEGVVDGIVAAGCWPPSS